MAEIHINGKKIEAKNGEMIIQAADREGVYIPRFCYHKKLSIAANCRMCLVEVEKAPKPLPACATPVLNGMNIFTDSKVTREAQSSVMEFLLVNHPLDCPICDQGGECELQDVAMGYGNDVSRYAEKKRVVWDGDIGALVSTDLTRCIHCTRCVRFGEEVAGFREIGLTQRGGHAEIGTYVEHALESEVSGNIIDLCPVGALTSKPFRFTARAWELTQKPGIAGHDCLGSNLHYHIRDDRVMRTVPQENEALNETWLSDRDRYAYLGFNHESRLSSPMIKRDGIWYEASWDEALDVVAKALSAIQSESKEYMISEASKQQSCSLKGHGYTSIGFLAAPNSTLEDAYLLRHLAEGLGSSHTDHRLHQRDFSSEDFSANLSEDARAESITTLTAGIGFEGGAEAFETTDCVLLIGSHIAREQPLLNLRLRKAMMNRQTKVNVISSVDVDYHFPPTGKAIISPQMMVRFLEAMLRTLESSTTDSAPFVSSKSPKAKSALFVDCPATMLESAQAFAKQLKAAKKGLIVLGAIAQQHPQAGRLKQLAHRISTLTDASFTLLTDGPNCLGATQVGCLPVGHLPTAAEQAGKVDGQSCASKRGLDTLAMLQAHLKAYFLLNIDPEMDCSEVLLMQAALKQADFVAALSPYASEALKECADVILPSVPYSETEGTYVNFSGVAQHFSAAVPPFEDSLPAWKILGKLAEALELEHFNGLASVITAQALEKRAQFQTWLDARLQPCPPTQLADQRENLLNQKNAQGKKQEEASSIDKKGTKQSNTLICVPEIGIYNTDNVVRRAQALQDSLAYESVNGEPAVRMNSKTAEAHHVQSGQTVTLTQNNHDHSFKAFIDNAVADDCVYVKINVGTPRLSFSDIALKGS